MAKIIVSACLLGFRCRYKGDGCPNEEIKKLSENNIIIPVCPEQAGGLPTPRLPSEIVGDKVIMKDGTDVTEQYKKGAKAALKTAQMNNADFCIMKANSPSCGYGMIYDGSFSGKKIEGNGITSDLLSKNGFTVYTENDLDKIENK